jgi:DNA modification methylase
LFGVKPNGKRTFNADAKKGSIVERYAVADKVSSIMYKLVKDADNLDDLEALFNQAKIEVKEMIDRRKQESGLIQCVIPNTIVYSGGLGKDKIHPTQKPVEVLEYFIELLSNPGDLVLDTFAGSGSTGIACHNTGRDCILVERDAVMFSKMKSRIDQINFLHKFSTID